MSVKRYLRSFANHTAYTTYINGQDVLLPNVSYCKQQNEMHYNPARDYSSEYLTFECLTGGTITIMASLSDVAGKTVSYSTDNGVTWSTLTTSTTAQSFGTFGIGDKVLFKGTNNVYSEQYEINYFGGTAQVKIYGNIMSLIYGDNFANQTSFPSNTNNNFDNLFSSYSNLIDAENLVLPATTLTSECYSGLFFFCSGLTKAPKILPATTLASGCYSSMFSDCSDLITAPELPATTLVSNCYKNMFIYCSSLNYVKAMFTTTPGNDYTQDWLSDVSATGTFVKNSTASWNVTGGSGIPSGWTVETASA